MSPSTPSVDVVIVNWNSGTHLHRAVASLSTAQSTRFAYGRVVVIDNASTDGSQLLDARQWRSLPLVVLHNRANIGFASACNQGARASVSDYIFFLNPDVELHSGSLEKAVEFLEADTEWRYGICGVRLVDQRGAPTESCARFPTPWGLVGRAVGLDRVFPMIFPPHFLSGVERYRSGTVDQIIGAFFFVRTAVFRQLSGFDERFFVYFEELDFSLRARQAGFSSHYLAEVSATHHGGASSSQVPAERLVFSWRSRVYYAFKHFQLWEAVVVLVGTVVLEPVMRLAWSVLRRSGANAFDTLRATGTFWKQLPDLIGDLHRHPAPPSSPGRRNSSQSGDSVSPLP